MPYVHEAANRTGFLDLLTEENAHWIKSRLKTYARRGGEEREGDVLDELLVVDPSTLQKTASFTHAVAVDGSLSTVEEPSVTALKIASVWKDLRFEPRYLNGVLDPSSLRQSFEAHASIGLLPGRGIYPANGEGSWDAKFREEFYQNLRHITVHNAEKRLSLLSYLRRILSEYVADNPLDCPNCAKDRIVFDTDELESFCDLCGVTVYFSDYVTAPLFSGSEMSTQPMLLLERLLVHALLEASAAGALNTPSPETTIFIADGSLQVFRQPELSKIFLKRTQAVKNGSTLVSFMKSGRVQDLFNYPGIEERVPPGHLMMVTSEVWKSLYRTRGEAGIYGKAFAYRTQSGDKWFSFMVPPQFGDPVDNAPILNSWENYPKLQAICELIEANQSHENGAKIATLELIGRANKAASLPAVLSRKVLEKLVFDGMA